MNRRTRDGELGSKSVGVKKCIHIFRTDVRSGFYKKISPISSQWPQGFEIYVNMIIYSLAHRGWLDHSKLSVWIAHPEKENELVLCFLFDVTLHAFVQYTILYIHNLTLIYLNLFYSFTVSKKKSYVTCVDRNEIQTSLWFQVMLFFNQSMLI